MFGKRNIIFLIFTFGSTWILWWLLAYLTYQEIIVLQDYLGFTLLIMGGSAPTIGAYVAVAFTKKKGGFKEFNNRVFKLKVHYKYYLYAFLVPILIGVFSLLIGYFKNAEIFIHHSINSLFIVLSAFIIAIIMGGVEEFGWRGILQAELTKKYNFFISNIVIGILWAVWHLPLFYILGTGHFENVFLIFLLSCIGYSSFLTFLYAKTESIFLCVIFHAMINVAAVVGLSIPLREIFSYFWLSIIMIFIGSFLLFNIDKQKKDRS